jgi:hypothetical protein
MRSTRSRVGGTMGRPSVTPLSNHTSNSSVVIVARSPYATRAPRERHADDAMVTS